MGEIADQDEVTAINHMTLNELYPQHRDSHGRFVADPHLKHRCDEQCVIDERRAYQNRTEGRQPSEIEPTCT